MKINTRHLETFIARNIREQRNYFTHLTQPQQNKIRIVKIDLVFIHACQFVLCIFE